MSISWMRRSELKNKVRRFAAEVISNTSAIASSNFDGLSDEENQLVEAEMQAIARRIEPEEAFANPTK